QARTKGIELPPKTNDDAAFIKVQLRRPVPKGGETRIRILKTYTDPASYSAKNGRLVFERALGIRRNIIILPAGWELVECATPGIVSTDLDGRIRVSFLNDRRPALGKSHRQEIAMKRAGL